MSKNSVKTGVKRGSYKRRGRKKIEKKTREELLAIVKVNNKELPLDPFSRKAARKKRTSFKAMTEARKEAVLHCKLYDDCLKKSFKNYKHKMECHVCTEKKLKKDYWRGGLQKHLYTKDNSSNITYPVHL